MKKLLFGVITTAVFSVSVNAKKITREDTRIKFAPSMSMLVDNYIPSFEKGMSYSDFKKDVVLVGFGNSTFPTKSANNLFEQSYTYLSKGAQFIGNKKKQCWQTFI